MNPSLTVPSEGTQSKARIVREPHIADKVVLVNGLPGCGKTMLSPIVGSLERVEMMRYNYHLEHICVLHHLRGITDDGASALLRIQTDLDLYDSMMSRETNFRFSDLSSPWSNDAFWRHIKRLFMAGDAVVPERIRKDRPILHLVTHLMLGVCRPLFDALGPRLSIVEGVRHPLYMIKQWYAWMPRAGTDPRMFGLWIEYEGHSLPWFAQGWESLYIRSNRMDRTIYSIINQWKLAMSSYNALSETEKKQVLIVPFEQFVMNPEPFMQRLEILLGTRIVAETRRMMRKQNVPREKWADGINLKIYRKYGWEPSAKNATERDELNKRREFVAAEASPEALAQWDALCQEYERTYLSL